MHLNVYTRGHLARTWACPPRTTQSYPIHQNFDHFRPNQWNTPEHAQKGAKTPKTAHGGAGARKRARDARSASAREARPLRPPWGEPFQTFLRGFRFPCLSTTTRMCVCVLVKGHSEGSKNIIFLKNRLRIAELCQKECRRVFGGAKKGQFWAKSGVFICSRG